MGPILVICAASGGRGVEGAATTLGPLAAPRFTTPHESQARWSDFASPVGREMWNDRSRTALAGLAISLPRALKSIRREGGTGWAPFVEHFVSLWLGGFPSKFDTGCYHRKRPHLRALGSAKGGLGWVFKGLV